MQENELHVLFQNLNLQEIPEVVENPQEANMAQAFHLEYLKTVPEFNGAPHTLSEYVRSAEVIINHYFANGQPQAQDVFLQTLVLSALRTKLSGRALLVTSGREIATWNELKGILQRSFADQRSENTLLRDLMLLKQKNETAQEYYEICQQTRSLLYSNLQLTEQDAAVRQVKKTQYDNLTLKAYLSGLKEPLGSFLRSMRPGTLEQAITYVIEEENVLYTRRNDAEYNKRMTLPQRKPVPGLRMNFPSTNFWQPSYQFQENQARVNNFSPNIRPMSFPAQRPNGQFQRPMPPQQFQRFPQQQQQQIRNVFAPQNRPQPRPTPMDIGSGMTRKTMQTNRFSNSNYQRTTNQRPFIQQSNQPRNFISEELHFQEEPLYEYEYEYEHEGENPQYECEEQQLENYEEQDFSPIPENDSQT